MEWQKKALKQQVAIQRRGVEILTWKFGRMITKSDTIFFKKMEGGGNCLFYSIGANPDINKSARQLRTDLSLHSEKNRNQKIHQDGGRVIDAFHKNNIKNPDECRKNTLMKIYWGPHMELSFLAHVHKFNSTIYYRTNVKNTSQSQWTPQPRLHKWHRITLWLHRTLRSHRRPYSKHTPTNTKKPTGYIYFFFLQDEWLLQWQTSLNTSVSARGCPLGFIRPGVFHLWKFPFWS